HHVSRGRTAIGRRHHAGHRRGYISPRRADPDGARPAPGAGHMKRLKPFIIGAAGGIFGLLLLPLSGILPITAIPGPPALVDWYLNMAAQQSIALRSLEIAVPDLDDPEMIARGAG